MLLFLASSSDVGRAALAAAFVRERDNWRHLPLESVRTVASLQGLQNDDPELLLRIACSCVEALREEGLAVLLTAEFPPEDVSSLDEAFGEKWVGVHVGDPDETTDSPFPHRIDPAGRTAAHVGEELAVLIASRPS